MRWTGILCVLVALAAGAGAAQDSDRVRIDLRVTGTAGGGRVVVDHGRDLGLAVDDRVVFRPLRAAEITGRIVELEERRATVALSDATRTVPVGTRAEAWVPRGRPDEAEEPEDVATEGEGPERPPWAVDEWEEGMPLLTEIEAVLPEDRERTITGRAYTIFDQVITDDTERMDSFWRNGASVVIENPYGRGGTIHLDGELSFRATRVSDEDDDDEDESRLRIDRMSYARGGNRFDQEGWEVGRFLQSGMPEFGVLDGFEFIRRLPDGNRVGMSIGVLPEPTPEQDTGEDLQLAAFYEWNSDASERLSVAGGFQRTWHDGDGDRELLVTRVRYLPLGPWSFYGGAWLDLYGSDDEIKTASAELTQAYATASRTWESGNGLSVEYDRLRYPELLREEFREIAPDILIDGGYDRLSFEGWRWTKEDRRAMTRLGLWDGEDDSGGDFEVGLDFENFQAVEGARLAARFFAVEGQFSSVKGTRVTYTRLADRGFWDVTYELSMHDQDGFDAGNDDLFLHRFRGSRSYHSPRGWSLSIHGEGIVDDTEPALAFGAAFQQSF